MARLADILIAAKRKLREKFEGDPLANPDLDARLLLAHVLNKDDSFPFLNPEFSISDEETSQFDSLIDRRCRHEPIARIIGEKVFWGFSLKLSEETLIPRLETEILVEHALNEIEKTGRTKASLKILDIGTGSGAILIALLSELPNANGYATDISNGILSVACENADIHKVKDRFHPIVADYVEGLSNEFDLIVSNPPYIAREESDTLQDEVKLHDPEKALFEGENGLAAYKKIIPWAFNHLKMDGLGLVEHGNTQHKQVASIARAAGFKRTECIYDLSKWPRVCLFGKFQPN